MLVGSRLPFAFSEEKQFPKVFSFVHPKFKTPTWSLLLFAAVTIIISISNSFLYAATISAITRVMIYGIVCFSLLCLRKRNTGQTGFFKIPYGKFFAIAGILLTLWLLSSSRLKEMRDVAIAVGVGGVIYFLVELMKKRQKPDSWCSVLSVFVKCLFWFTVKLPLKKEYFLDCIKKENGLALHHTLSLCN